MEYSGFFSRSETPVSLTPIEHAIIGLGKIHDDYPNEDTLKATRHRAWSDESRRRILEWEFDLYAQPHIPGLLLERRRATDPGARTSATLCQKCSQTWLRLN